MKKTLLDTMVDRFLGWKLPATFYPDGGITFEAAVDATSPHWPVGTNLLTADQAKQMFEYVLDGVLPSTEGFAPWFDKEGVLMVNGGCSAETVARAAWFVASQQIDRTTPALEPGDTLDDEHPLWLVNEQIKGLLEGDGAHEDHENVLQFLRGTGLPEGTVRRMHAAIVHGDSKVQPLLGTSSAPQQGRFGDKDLLDQLRTLCTAIENLPAGYHQSVMSMRAGELAFGLRRLQTIGDYVWPTQLVEVVLNRPDGKFVRGDRVRKTKGSQWRGRVVGTYSTELTPEGYAVESSTEKGSVQIYPAAALELDTEV